MEEKKYLKFWQKACFGLSGVGNNFCWSFAASYVLLYCTDAAGVQAAAVGTAMMISKVLDGITDVMMGKIIDATHSKMGKGRFWMFISTIPMALCVYFLFNVPASFSENTKIVYIFIVYTLMGAVFYTMNCIANYTVIALVTRNQKEQVQLKSATDVLACAGIIIMTYVTSGLVEYFGGGQQGWRAVSIIYSIVVVTTLMIAVFSVKELPEEELGEQSGKQPAKAQYGFLEMIKLLFTNKYFIIMLLLYLFMYFFYGVYAGMGAYYATYNLGNGTLYGVLTMASMIPIVILGSFAGNYLARFKTMRQGIMIAMCVATIGAVVTFIGGMAGSFLIVCVGMLIAAAGKVPFSGALAAYLAEVAENIRLKKNKDMLRSVISCSSIGVKVGTGIGTAVCGFMLTYGGYVANAATQSTRALNTIAIGYLGGFALSVISMLVAILFLDVEKDNQRLKAV